MVQWERLKDTGRGTLANHFWTFDDPHVRRTRDLSRRARLGAAGSRDEADITRWLRDIPTTIFEFLGRGWDWRNDGMNVTVPQPRPCRRQGGGPRLCGAVA